MPWKAGDPEALKPEEPCIIQNIDNRKLNPDSRIGTGGNEAPVLPIWAPVAFDDDCGLPCINHEHVRQAMMTKPNKKSVESDPNLNPVTSLPAY
jgi:hypothetical protein